MVEEGELESFVPICNNFLLFSNYKMFHCTFGPVTWSCSPTLLFLNGHIPLI